MWQTDLVGGRLPHASAGGYRKSSGSLTDRPVDTPLRSSVTTLGRGPGPRGRTPGPGAPQDFPHFWSGAKGQQQELTSRLQDGRSEDPLGAEEELPDAVGGSLCAAPC